MHRAIVIGAGIGGIAAAIRLAVKGYAVDVYEAAEKPGGKLNELHLSGYRFDMGPSLFTLPELVDELFNLAGEDVSEHFTYNPLEIITKYFYADGSTITAWQDVDRFAAEIEAHTSDNAATFKAFLDYSARIYDLTKETFLFRSLHKLDTFLTPEVGRAITKLHHLDLLRTMHQAISARFSDPRLVQLFDRYATYNGSNPYQAPATLNVIPHLEHRIGAYFPTEGMYAITKALVALAERIGVRFHYLSPVEQVVYAAGCVHGVKVAGEVQSADVVVSDIDITKLYQQLMPEYKVPKRYINQPKSSSALIFYWCMDRTFPELDLHNIFFTRDYRKEFDQLFTTKGVNTDPTIYVFISSKAVPTDAPAGGENWFVMINVPHNNGQDWDKIIDQERQLITERLSRQLGIAVADHIVGEHVLDPRGIEANTGSHLGALYGNSSNNRFAAFLRHPNFSRRINGLFFTGGSVHPGGGIPLCLASAKIVDQLVAKP